jgi:hypothetical protein
MDTMTEPRFRRPTRVEMEARLDAILDIVEEIEPCSVRQAFYQTVVRGLMDTGRKPIGSISANQATSSRQPLGRGFG